MITLQASQTARMRRNLKSERRLWHDGARYALPLGCATCPDQHLCGGLQIGHPVFDCLSLCSCVDRSKCDVVCRRKPDEFVMRLLEVDGFSLDNVPRAPILTTARLATIAPLVYHGNRRQQPFAPPVACLQLYQVLERQDGAPRFSTGKELRNRFRIAESTRILLTGTAADRPLERWWSLSSKRQAGIRALRELDIQLVTVPNYSLFIDQPRWDDLHSMKRIAIAHEEFLREGIPAALHLNARTDRDWSRWTDYVRARSEVTHVAFEFATGAGWAKRTDWHATRLVALAAAVDRPLHLTIRGGKAVMPALSKAFSGITLLETSVFIKTMRRQRASASSDGDVRWEPCPTEPNEALDALLRENWTTVAASYGPTLNPNAGSGVTV